MENNEKLIVAGLGILVVIAIIYAFTMPPAITPVVKKDNTAQVELLRKGIRFGENAVDYTYGYSESVDGYKTTYTLVKSANQSSINITSPLSSKRVYFLENDTILCITYPVNETCSSLNNTQDEKMKSYLNSLKSVFLSQSQIHKNKDDADYLIQYEYLTVSPDTTKKQINGHECDEITYQLNYTSMPISEAVRFGIGPTTPKIFGWKMCIDNTTGFVYTKYFNYTNAGLVHEYWYELTEYKNGSSNISAPEVELGDMAPFAIRDEKTQQAQLVDCYLNKRGDVRDTCISNKALELKRTDMCQLAGARKDRCLVSLVPLLKNESICTMIIDISYKDDCQIELAGAYKNSSYCTNLNNQSKNALCVEAATPRVITNTTTQNQTIPRIPAINTSSNTTTNHTNLTSADIEALNVLGRTETVEGNQTIIINSTQNGSG